MADVLVACDSCGAETTVSTYIDPDMAKCSSCGEKLDVPFAHANQPRKASSKQKQSDTPASSVLANHGASTSKKGRRGKKEALVNEDGGVVLDRASNIRQRQKRRKQRMMIGDFVPGMKTILAAFILVGGFLAFLSYGNALSEGDKDILKYGGTICLTFGWLCVVVDAFNDNAMFGLLSLLVPFYFIVYLYTQCDSLLLRFMVGVLMLGFGIDFVKASIGVVNMVIEWLGGVPIGGA